MNPHLPRREFLACSAAGGVAGALGISATGQSAVAASVPGAKRELYELWLYLMTAGEMMKKADVYFERALIPALRRAGTGPVGVFVESSQPDSPTVYALIPHAGWESPAAVAGALQNDAEYQKTGAAFLAASPKQPAYVNHEARLMLAAAFMPAIEVPEKKTSRMFELRRYRNPSEAAFRKKLEMFATGELTIFRRVGLNPVFFGEMLFGPDMFNITYMLTYPDGAARGKAWDTFRKDADWQKLRVTPGFTDPEIIANIKSLTLVPTAYSQI
ncbi:MAG TPA: NIPSNAP family protein [Pirellulales bacterium]|nr:NIPSNAP family protein [Pirellulales bacterium]